MISTPTTSVDSGRAQPTTWEQPPALRQPLITEKFREHTLPEPAGCDTIKFSSSNKKTSRETFDENCKDGCLVVPAAGGVIVEAAIGDQGKLEDNPQSSTDVRKTTSDDDEQKTTPPVEDVCKFVRGTCTLHNKKGVKYHQTSKKWKDRGGGKGYGFVISRYVRYRCQGGEKNNPCEGEKSASFI